MRHPGWSGAKRVTNTFAQAPDRYAAARPHYPDALFDWIPAVCEHHEAAWDCATGNGQAAIGLARFFRHVEATDISTAQVGQGFAAANIRYSAQPAERTSFADGSFDVVAVAQALHWFDYDQFWPEVRRVARPGALFCAWGYAWFRGPEAVNRLLLDPVARLVEPYWASNNGILWRGYRDEEVRFPFDRIATPELWIERNWSTLEAAAYIRTWSAFQRAAADGRGPELEHVLDEAERQLGPDARHACRVPLTVLAGRID